MTPQLNVHLTVFSSSWKWELLGNVMTPETFPFGDEDHEMYIAHSYTASQRVPVKVCCVSYVSLTEEKVICQHYLHLREFVRVVTSSVVAILTHETPACVDSPAPGVKTKMNSDKQTHFKPQHNMQINF